MRVTLIVAVGTGGVIGRQGTIPWHLPADLMHFKKTTMGSPIVMGRRTFYSIGKPLPGRRNLVLTRTPEMLPDGVEGFGSSSDALKACANEEEIFIIGGAEIYLLFQSEATRCHLTEVDGDFEGDTFFPPLDPLEWQVISSEERAPDEKNPHRCVFKVLERRAGIDR